MTRGVLKSGGGKKEGLGCSESEGERIKVVTLFFRFRPPGGNGREIGASGWFVDDWTSRRVVVDGSQVGNERCGNASSIGRFEGK